MELPLTGALNSISVCPTICRLSLPVASGYYMLQLEKWMDLGSTIQRHTRSRPILANITHLTVPLGQKEYSQPFLPVSWFKALFPNLETLFFDDRSAFPLNSDAQTLHAKRLSEACPALLNISFLKGEPPQPIAQYLRKNS